MAPMTYTPPKMYKGGRRHHKKACLGGKSRKVARSSRGGKSRSRRRH